MSADTPHIHVSHGTAVAASAVEGMRFGASEKAASMFKAAQRHSVRVRVLKTALPVAALALGAVFSWYTFLATPATPVKVEVNDGGESGKLVMSNPQLNGYTKDNRPYSMIATRAVQDAKNSGSIALEGISAELPVGARGSAKIEAASGVYDNANGRLQLDKDFTVITDEGLRAVMRNADVNLKSGQVTTDKPVDIRNGSTQISADSMQIKESGKVLIFENKVRVVIDGNSVSGEKAPENDRAG
ncbi:LPS export ABC transporter periplasmic protein LptC [Ochrobactrum sp. Marseille-Q0166]|uniref:LPS export ABC transporter periplasmic protein LptC n=1 Tax=Ochrobactrum sp. Marseille-Q0166 TaxID=2761105 RepID=UPI001655FC2F|nr:LPS export ABC transporter periplasmic protein LptC [Ochrobactrum sp. Marseille-Q0166]MBC8716087.1 LPS export ABC transporter periplasmic protein LptC [Ochrobactrum sp. Marseille-Q0166]